VHAVVVLPQGMGAVMRVQNLLAAVEPHHAVGAHP